MSEQPFRLPRKGPVLEADGSYLTICLYCHNVFRVPPREDCRWCRKKKAPMHGKHQTCPVCYDTYRLIQRKGVETAERIHGQVPLAILLKIELERGRETAVGPSGEG